MSIQSTGKKDAGPQYVPEVMCRQSDLLNFEDRGLANWLFKDIDALDYFAGDVERIPSNVWEYLERLRSKRGEDLYVDLLVALAHKRFPRTEARRLWFEILEHKYYMSEKLGRNVGIRVAVLDFLHNQRGLVRDLRLLPERDLDCLLLFVNEDGLTGVYNHRYFQEQLRLELGRAHRYKRHLGLLLLDLDHFKLYNDDLGHRQGDKLLKDAGAFFQEVKRESDTVARYGGDEFAFILPETDFASVMTYGKRLRAEFEARHFGVRENQGQITISIGAAAFPDDAHEAEQLIETADQALYRAKRAGGNGLRGGRAEKGKDHAAPAEPKAVKPHA
jgi:diguanylate cyclase (GGDEF)-like protein